MASSWVDVASKVWVPLVVGVLGGGAASLGGALLAYDSNKGDQQIATRDSLVRRVQASEARIDTLEHRIVDLETENERLWIERRDLQMLNARLRLFIAKQGLALPEDLEGRSPQPSGPVHASLPVYAIKERADGLELVSR